MQGYEENLLLLLENIKKQVPDNDIMPVWLAGYQIQACIDALQVKAKLEKFIEDGQMKVQSNDMVFDEYIPQTIQGDGDHFKYMYETISRDRMKGWIKVEEAHPEEFKTVLLLYNVEDGIIQTGWYKEYADSYRNETAAYYGQPVAWMPLPEIPDMSLFLK